ncbi:MAG: amidohydrolase family protein, partial [Myxococcota bacterium]
NVAGYRKAFQTAYERRRALKRYDKELERWKEKQADPDNDDDSTDPPDPPERDLGLDTLVKVLDGEILVHTHCYRADEMHIMLDLAQEYGFKIRSFHHALEAYKLADRLAAEGTASSTWADWWGFKIEAFDGVPQNAALLTRAGARAIIHSDSAEEIRHLNQEAAKAMTAGRRVGIGITEDQALAWITLNPAWALGVDDRTGSLEVGKMADAVIWSRHPFSVYALAEKVYIDGTLAYDRADPRVLRKSDFELGLFSEGVLP